MRPEIEAAAQKILASLARGPRTAWDLKLELKVSHTVLHLALGMLLERGKIGLRPDNLTYLVEAVTEPARPPVLAA